MIVAQTPGFDVPISLIFALIVDLFLVGLGINGMRKALFAKLFSNRLIGPPREGTEVHYEPRWYHRAWVFLISMAFAAIGTWHLLSKVFHMF